MSDVRFKLNYELMLEGDLWIDDIVNEVIEDDNNDEVLSMSKSTEFISSNECVSTLWNCLSEITLNVFNGLHSSGKRLSGWELPFNFTHYTGSSIRKIESAASCFIHHDRCQSGQ